MTRLKLIIADTDETYVESIAGYFMLNYSQRFQVSSFTDKACLVEYLSDESNKIDVLLIDSELYSREILKGNVATVILLTVDRVSSESNEYYTISKYQQGDKIVSDIFNIYAQKDDGDIINITGEKKTKVVAVYSPIGGSGKTTISTSCAIQCAQKGLKVFYLNLEDFQSTALFCDCRGGQNLSNILYYLKDKSKNLQLRIESAKCIDGEYNIHYFCPPESLLDLQDSKPEELKTLLGELKSMGQYDIVYVDMSSSFDDRNISILDSSDEILLVLPQDAVSDIKIDLFSNEMDILKQRKGIDFSDKINLVLNKYNSYMALEVETVSVCGNSIDYYIPVVPGMMAIKGNNRLMDLQGHFTESIEELIERYKE
ncbi:AAA family ATPase [Acetivibrio cellulolyticus]|uniref:AAA family ATPase n=1 Tax=Acetivibrio cellulolyticus TaxID=35830 RepID=UPI0001E2D09F|nr:AAA family ATPase [Acetivibrio cellulolyticus]